MFHFFPILPVYQSPHTVQSLPWVHQAFPLHYRRCRLVPLNLKGQGPDCQDSRFTPHTISWRKEKAMVPRFACTWHSRLNWGRNHEEEHHCLSLSQSGTQTSRATRERGMLSAVTLPAPATFRELPTGTRTTLPTCIESQHAQFMSPRSPWKLATDSLSCGQDSPVPLPAFHSYSKSHNHWTRGLGVHLKFHPYLVSPPSWFHVPLPCELLQGGWPWNLTCTLVPISESAWRSPAQGINCVLLQLLPKYWFFLFCTSTSRLMVAVHDTYLGSQTSFRTQDIHMILAIRHPDQLFLVIVLKFLFANVTVLGTT